MATNTLSPDTLARLNDARARLGHAEGLRATLDRWHATLAEENPALSATEVGEAWRECWGRAGVCLDATRRELDQLLDGDMAGADDSRWIYFAAGNALAPRVDALAEAFDRR